MLSKLPAAWLSGVRLALIDEDKCEVKVRFKWINQNPYRSMFWAVQGMAAELTTGMLLTKSIQDSNTNISMLLVSNKSNFHKKAVGNNAVQEISAGKLYWKGTHAVLVSKSGFTKSAQKLAKANRVKLISESELKDLENLIF